MIVTHIRDLGILSTNDLSFNNLTCNKARIIRINRINTQTNMRMLKVPSLAYN